MASNRLATGDESQIENIDVILREDINLKLGPNTTRMLCPHCSHTIFTQVCRKTTVKTHLMCLLLSCTWCLCCVPYCMDSCRNADHFCPLCQAYIGTYHA